MNWVDFHTHILDSPHVEAALTESQKAGVVKWLVNSTDLDNWKTITQKASGFSPAIVGLGWHPEQVIAVSPNEIDSILQQYNPLIPLAPYFGETGLDFKYGKTPGRQAAQKNVFGQFIDWSNEHDKLIQVHTRQARQESLDLLTQKKARNVLLHWFSGNKKQQDLIIERKWVCTVGPTILNSSHMDAFILNQPLELLGLETDSPIPFDGKPSSPAWIPLVARRVAEIKNVGLEQVSEAQHTIFARFFPEFL